MDAEIVVLRLLHIVPGVIWVGGSIFLAVLLLPALTKTGPPHSAMLMANMAKPMTMVMHSAAWLTMIMGVVMAFRVRPDGLFDVLWSTGWGWMIFLGLIFAIIGYTFGTIAGLTSKRMGVLGASLAGRPPEPAEAAEMGSLQTRVKITARLAALLVTTSVVTMALAQHV